MVLSYLTSELNQIFEINSTTLERISFISDDIMPVVFFCANNMYLTRHKHIVLVEEAPRISRNASKSELILYPPKPNPIILTLS